MSNSHETLLRNNRRAAALLVFFAVWPMMGGIGLAASTISRSTWLAVLGAGVALIGGYQVIRQLIWLLLPRLAVSGDCAVLYVNGLRPYRIPLEVVECFFIGQAPSQVRVRHPAGDRVQNVTVVVRLSERATDWHRKPVNPALARWCDGYITLLGDWCEPLNGDVVNRLNHRLAEIKRQSRARASV